MSEEIPGFDVRAAIAGELVVHSLDDLMNGVTIEEDEYEVGEDFTAQNSFLNIDEIRKLPVPECFEELRQTMAALDDDGFVLKELMKDGVGPTISKNAKVAVHYQMFFEGSTESFDSTFLRKRTQVFDLELGNYLPAMEIALTSMKVQETSRFIFSWKLAYGEHGAPPRIPGKKDILTIIQLVKVLDYKIPEVQSEHPEKLLGVDFKKSIQPALDMLQLGKEYYKRKYLSQSVNMFRDALKYLGRITVSNDLEEDELETLKMRLNVNAAGVCNYGRKPEQAVLYSQEALRYDTNNRMALIHLGKAHASLTNYGFAEKSFRKCLRLCPNDDLALKELNLLLNKKKK